VIESHRVVLDAVVEALLEYETLEGDALGRLLADAEAQQDVRAPDPVSRPGGTDGSSAVLDGIEMRLHGDRHRIDDEGATT
jgi:hypothetical protein